MNLRAGSLARALDPGIKFLLAKDDSGVHTLITRVASLEEEAKYSIIKITAWTIQAVSLTVVLLELLLECVLRLLPGVAARSELISALVIQRPLRKHVSPGAA